MIRGIRALALAAALTLLPVTVLPAAPASAATARYCTSKTHPKLAKRLSADLRTALRGRSSTTSFALYDRRRGLWCFLASTRRYDSASTVKVAVVATLLKLAHKRGLTAREKSLARAAITRSDNNATSKLWSQVGRARVQRLFDQLGMRSTRASPSAHWGLTQITAYDQLKLLRMLTSHGAILNDASRSYLLGLMHDVTPGQRWGTPAGAPRGVSVHVKNGWVPRRTHRWRVHSLGTFDGRGRDYMFAVLTHDDPSMSYGVASIERIARAVHRSLNPQVDARLSDEPTTEVEETTDGSAPW
ncbi:MAG: serine hydrolase [Streptosporangiaceae bacterium]